MTVETPTQPEIDMQAAVKQALSNVILPKLNKDIVTLGRVHNIAVCSGIGKAELILTSAEMDQQTVLAEQAKQAVLSKLPEITEFNITIKPAMTPAAKKPGVVPPAPQQVFPNIKNIIAVSSGKGGVGKSTTAINLACSVAQRGYKVGIVDADIYGPNVPLMIGLPNNALQGQTEEGKLIPPMAHGVKVMSMAFLVKPDQPVVWRGPMLDKVIRQFLADTDWEELDYLFVDLPPGTGDAQLTIIQSTPVKGAVIVTTPQDVALLDSRKGLAMFANANIPVLGIVENMSYFISKSGEREDIFGHGGGKRAAEELGVPFLGEVPLMTEVRAKADSGWPIVMDDPNNPVAQALNQATSQLLMLVEEINAEQS